MNGATTDPWLNTINAPNKAKIIIIGRSQYFFLTLRNSQNSLIKDTMNVNLLYISLIYLLLKIYEKDHLL